MLDVRLNSPSLLQCQVQVADAQNAKTARISVGDELAGVLKRDQDMFGLGPEAALKAIQVSFLLYCW